MSTNDLHLALLRVPILHILRASGFHAARPAALDTLMDIAARYLTLIASKTAEHAYLNHNDPVPDLLDVQMALRDVGALRPQKGVLEEQISGTADMRGMEVLGDWLTGAAHREIRRIAGLVGTEAEVLEGDAEVEREDFLAALKKKHSKTGEESRFQGTVLGKSADSKRVRIDGADVDSIQAWEAKRRQFVPLSSSRRTSATLTSTGQLSYPSSPLSDV